MLWLQKQDNKETNHDHFLSCSLSEIQQSAKIGTLTKTLHSLKTTTTIINLITSGMNTYYNNNTKEFLNKEDILVTKQQEIEWNNFTRDWVSSEFIKSITKHYKSKHITCKFTGKWWVATIIKTILEVHVNEWLNHCNNSFTTQTNKNNFSLEKQSLLQKIQYLYQQTIDRPIKAQS